MKATEVTKSETKSNSSSKLAVRTAVRAGAAGSRWHG